MSRVVSPLSPRVSSAMPTEPLSPWCLTPRARRLRLRRHRRRRHHRHRHRRRRRSMTRQSHTKRPETQRPSAVASSCSRPVRIKTSRGAISGLVQSALRLEPRSSRLARPASGVPPWATRLGLEAPSRPSRRTFSRQSASSITGNVQGGGRGSLVVRNAG